MLKVTIAAALATAIRAVRVQVALSAEAVAAYGARAVLVRPDGFVAWAGDEVAEAATVLVRAAGVRP